MDMELDQLYKSIDRLKAKGAVADTYGGTDDPCDPDGGALSDLIEYICVWHSKNRPDWPEALYQVLSWQYQTFYEGAGGYYENFYGESPRELQVKTADFLEEHGYLEIAAQYRQGMDSTIQGIYEWMGDNLEAVWQFCLDVLEAHRLDWPEPEERDTDV